MSSAQVGTVLRHIQKLATVRKDNELPDRDLLERFARDGDESAFAALLERHGAMVLSVCRNVLHDLHDAEDAFQAAFLLLARKAGSIHRREAVSGWLYRVAYHTALRLKANAARRRIIEKRAVTMPSADPVLDLSLREVRSVLFEELDALPEEYRAPLVLCGLEEKSLEESARLLGWTKGTVKGRLQRGRELLRGRLRQRGLELPAVLAASALALHTASTRVSAALAESTLRAAVQVAAGGGGVVGAVSAEVAALVQGASKSMFHGKLTIATALLLAIGVAATTVGFVRHRAAAADPPAAPHQVRADQPKPQPREAQPTIAVQGRVLDPDGKPVAGAKLYLATGIRHRQTASEQATSGADGRFRLTVRKSETEEDSPDESPPQLMAITKGHGCDWSKIDSAKKEITLRLVKDVPVTGRILDPDGKPVVGARLTINGVSAFHGEGLGKYIQEARKGFGIKEAKYWDGPLPGQAAVLTTGADGRFRLAGVGRERVVYMHIEGPHIASTGLGPVMTRTAQTIVDTRGMKLYGASFDHVGLASRPVRGVVRDKATGIPLAGVSVEHYHGQGPAALTDKEGRYELLGLVKSRRYSLVVNPPDGRYFRLRVHLEDTPGLAPLVCDIELTREVTVRGRVTDKATGKPVVGARVDYNPLAGNNYANLMTDVAKPSASATTGPDGSYTLTVMPGQGVIGVAAPRLDVFMPALVTPKQIKDFFKNPVIERQSEDFLTVAGGRNSFGAISQNSYNALVLVEPGEKEKELTKDVTLERPLERKGRVFAPDGQPLPGVRVCGLVRHGVHTLKGAEFTVRGINPRANRPLVFYHKEKNLGFYLKDLRGDSTVPLTVKLQPCGSASGRILDPDGAPVAGLHLVVQGRALPIFGDAGGGSQLLTTDKEGRFRAVGLVPGQEYRVSEAHHNGILRIYAPARVTPGKHQDLGDIKMDPQTRDQ